MSHYSAFHNDKNQFFSQIRTSEDKFKTAADLAHGQKYFFLLNNQAELEAEFVHQFAVLKRRKDENSEAFWAYCGYCAELLEIFYKGYSPGLRAKDGTYIPVGKEAYYKQLKEKIKAHDLSIKEPEIDFIDSMIQRFIEGFQTIMKAPWHLSKLREYVAFVNLSRLYWVFCRLTLTSGFAFAKSIHLIDKLNGVFGSHINADKIIAILQAPNGVLTYFSVGLFLARFMIDAGLLIRHTFFPSEEEKKSTAFERFKHELNKRQYNFANDLVWATVNFLTNFNQISRIPSPVTGIITAVFMGFDMSLLLYRLTAAKKNYMLKKNQYLQELTDYKDPMKYSGLKQSERDEHILVLNRQLAELEVEWKTKKSSLCFAASAAGLLMLGFSAALLFTPPGMVVASFFVCTLAAAIYFTGDSYANYKQKQLRLDHMDFNPKERALALKEYQTARNDFIIKIIKNTFMPTLLIATFAICWPAAVALTVAYLGYEIFSACNKHPENKPKPPVAVLDAPNSALAMS